MKRKNFYPCTNACVYFIRWRNKVRLCLSRYCLNIANIFLVCNHLTWRPCWWSIQWKLFQRIYIKMEFSSQRKELFCSWPPTWLAWRHLRTSNWNEALLLYSTICWRPKCQNLFCWRVNKYTSCLHVFFLSIMVQGEFVSLSFTYIMHTYARQ